MNDQTLLQWSQELGVSWPNYKLRLKQLASYLRRFVWLRYRAWRGGTYFQGQQLLQEAPSERAKREMSILIWHTGSIILLAHK